MAIQKNINTNAKLWGALYGEGSLSLGYPDENLVRLFKRPEPGVPNSPARVLDHGFGSGNNALFMALEGYEVHGAEVSQASVDSANDLFQKANLSGDFKLIDALHLDYEDNFFDMVVSWNCMHYNGTQEAVETVRDELLRILKPGGTLLLSTISRKHSLCYGADILTNGQIRVPEDYRFDNRKGLTLFVPYSRDHFMEIYAKGFEDAKYGWLDDFLFVEDKPYGCHLLHARKPK